MLLVGLLPLMLAGARQPWIATNEDITASIQFVSAKQSWHFEPSPSRVFDRMIDTDRKLISHKITTRVTFDNVRRDPCIFVCKWYDPDGKLIGETTRHRPDPDPRVRYRGHWSRYPIVDGLEFKDRPMGKYTFVVEYPAGTVLADRSEPLLVVVTLVPFLRNHQILIGVLYQLRHTTG